MRYNGYDYVRQVSKPGVRYVNELVFWDLHNLGIFMAMVPLFIVIHTSFLGTIDAKIGRGFSATPHLRRL